MSGPRSTRALGLAAFGQLCFLAVTGAYLFFEYRPSAGGGSADTRVSVARAVRTLHGVDAWLVIATALALAIVVLVEHGRRSTALKSWVTVAVGAVALITGYLLPWDQLAVTAVTVGANFSGYRWLFEDRVRFVLIGGSEVDVSTVARWLAVHVLVGLLALASSAALLVVRSDADEGGSHE